LPENSKDRILDCDLFKRSDRVLVARQLVGIGASYVSGCAFLVEESLISTGVHDDVKLLLAERVCKLGPRTKPFRVELAIDFRESRGRYRLVGELEAFIEEGVAVP